MPDVRCPTCKGDGEIPCTVHDTMNEACFTCWNGEPCPDCNPTPSLTVSTQETTT